MKKIIISTLAVFAATLSFAQEHGKEGTRINHHTGEKEQIVRIKPHKKMPATHVAAVGHDQIKDGRKTKIKKHVKPAVKKYKARHQQKDKMAPKGNFKTK